MKRNLITATPYYSTENDNCFLKRQIYNKMMVETAKKS